MDLADVVASHRVVVCVGSGGVGKTTTSAAIALHAARQGKRALCLTIDPARRLANSLGLSELTREEQQIDPAHFATHGLNVPGTLTATMLDMKRVFDDLVHKHASTERQRETILNNRIYQYVSTSLAGTQEYMAMEKLHAVRQDERFDFVVLDTPPTTNALDFLDAPQKLVGAIDSPVMRWFVEVLEDNKGLGLVGRGAAFVLKGLSRFTGTEFLDHVGQFINELNELFGGFRQRANSVYEALRGDDVAFLVVTSPAPQAVAEAVFFSKKLGEYGITPRGILVNRVHTPVELSTGDATLLAELEERLPGNSNASRLLNQMQQATAEANLVARSDQEGIRRLRQHVGEEMSYTEIPAMDTDVHDLAALAEIGAHFNTARPAA